MTLGTILVIAALYAGLFGFFHWLFPGKMYVD